MKNKVCSKNSQIKKLEKDLAIRRCQLQDCSCAKEMKILNPNQNLKSF